MEIAEYIEKSARTAANGVFYSPKDQKEIDLLHAGIGLTTESGEFLDQIKRVLFYGKPLDEVNLIEELGDVQWYFALACRALGVTPQEVWDRNISKLSKRFPEKFTEHHALNRDLDTERKALEGVA